MNLMTRPNVPLANLSPRAQLRAGRPGRRLPQLVIGLMLYGVSMAMMVRTFSTICRQCNAAFAPMLTWSSTLPEDGIVSTLSGWARVLFSEHNAAAVYCRSMKPEFNPP